MQLAFPDHLPASSHDYKSPTSHETLNTTTTSTFLGHPAVQFSILLLGIVFTSFISHSEIYPQESAGRTLPSSTLIQRRVLKRTIPHHSFGGVFRSEDNWVQDGAGHQLSTTVSLSRNEHYSPKTFTVSTALRAYGFPRKPPLFVNDTSSFANISFRQLQSTSTT